VVRGSALPNQVSDAVFAPAMTLNGAEQLRKSSISADRYNVRWLHMRILPPEQFAANAFKYINSMFLIHYGNALVAIQPPHACHGTLKVLGSVAESPMRLNAGQYAEYNYIPRGIDVNLVQYIHSQKMIADIKRLQSDFTKEFTQRGVGFLHPACWLEPGALIPNPNPYTECDSMDIIPGVHVKLPAVGEADNAPNDDPLSAAMNHMNCERVEVDRGDEAAGIVPYQGNSSILGNLRPPHPPVREMI